MTRGSGGLKSEAGAQATGGHAEPSGSPPVNGITDPSTEDLQAKAAVLHEALPWIKRFTGRTVVVKYGGAAMATTTGPEAASLDSFVGDVVLLRYVGVDLVVVHGGGPEISQTMERFGKQPVFVDGLRVTDADTMDLVRMVLVGRVNKALVGRINTHGRLAVGLSGEDGLLLTARPKQDPGGRDLGLVGEVAEVDPTALRALTGAGLIPVVATVAAGPGGQPYNINADTVAGALAAALKAEKLVYLSDVEGLYADLADSGSLIRRLGLAELEAMLADGHDLAGMVPKLEGIATAIRSGVHSAHILDGRLRHALLLELFTDRGVGTMVTRSSGGANPAPPDPPVGPASLTGEEEP
jgi:acetylglutamate kinase